VKKKVGFLIRKFEHREDRNKLIALVENSFQEKGLKVIDAIEKGIARNIQFFKL